MQKRVTAKRATGDVGESVAAEFLRRKGFIIIERNFLKPWGEIDIIAEKSGSVRFVEVKTVSRESLPDVSVDKDEHRPEEMVHEHKLKKVARTAEMYMNQKGDTRDYQIDVVGVYLSFGTRKARCRLFEQVL